MEGNLKSADERKDFVLEVPDGGWGYVVVAATVVVLSVTLIPMTVFGLIYGDFLKSIGDETEGTTLSNGIFNTISSLVGLITSMLLNKYSNRQVGMLGAAIYFVGGAALVFVQNLVEMIIFFGIIQGLGFGLLWPAVMAAFNSYFDKKMNVMMNVCHTSISAFNMVVPALATWSMDTFGFRGTMIAVAVLGFLSIPATASLEPVEKHMKKVYAQNADNKLSAIPLVDVLKEAATQIEPLMRTEYGEEEETLSCWQSMGMPMLGDLKYLNITIGLSLAYTSDAMFISIIPLMLGNIGFDDHQIAIVMTVFFASDLLARVVLTFVSYVVTFRSRLVVLLSSALIIICRVAFVSNDSFMWELIVLGALGFLRCFIISSLTLVIADEYQDNFPTAYSMFMVVMGVVTLIMSPLISLVKSYTHSDVMVCHFLTLAYVSCVVFWTFELAIFRKKKRCETK